MKLAKFLDKYDTVIFDMDGVITSEQNYWNCAALTVWEYLHYIGGKKINSAKCAENMAQIRKKVFSNDSLISVLKGKGVNSNWDLGYVTVLISWICGGKDGWGDFDAVLRYAENLSDNIIDEYDRLAKLCHEKTGFDYNWLRRNEIMWRTMRDIFQMWFLGDELFEERFGYPPMNTGKTGLLYREEPIVKKDRLIQVLRLLGENKRICTGTGRPYIEMIQPVTDWGIKQYFAADGLCNYDHVVAAERSLDNNTLTKPHPYMFLKALYGTDYDDKRLVDGDYDKEKIKTTLVVGDAGADILAAKAMGADFCAVLTGIQGKKARPYFESLNAEYILNSVEDFLEE
ncbi:MAG: HAD hydrolase-like protein [Oscillospiraceae bacterium]|nr:HAD hydrolase-like protein [Oscillospiraceae bacterium]